MPARRPSTGLRRLRRAARRRVRDRLLGSGEGSRRTLREDLAARYLRGEGIEIGALHLPLRVPPRARVRYVDQLPAAQLRERYALTIGDPTAVVEPDVLDDGERLAAFADGSLDFVIANHMLEHVEDPVAALEHLLRVLRSDGILFLTLPDPRFTFDGRRERTSVEHVLRDHREGPRASRRWHYEEWARIVECVPEAQLEARIAGFEAADTRHHFHVWELEDFLALLLALELPCRIERAETGHEEFAVVVRKTAS